MFQFIKFSLIGISNSIIYYTVEILSYYILLKSNILLSNNHQLKVLVVTIIAFIISVINSYFLNSRYVFHKKKNSLVFLRMIICYALTGLLLSPFIKILLSMINIPYWIISLFTLILMLPLNFFINKFWAFNK